MWTCEAVGKLHGGRIVGIGWFSRGAGRIKLASGSQSNTTLMYADVSRAYFYAKAERPVYVKLPDEDREAGDEHRCGPAWFFINLHGLPHGHESTWKGHRRPQGWYGMTQMWHDS